MRARARGTWRTDGAGAVASASPSRAGRARPRGPRCSPRGGPTTASSASNSPTGAALALAGLGGEAFTIEVAGGPSASRTLHAVGVRNLALVAPCGAVDPGSDQGLLLPVAGSGAHRRIRLRAGRRHHAGVGVASPRHCSCSRRRRSRARDGQARLTVNLAVDGGTRRPDALLDRAGLRLDELAPYRHAWAGPLLAGSAREWAGRPAALPLRGRGCPRRRAHPGGGDRQGGAGARGAGDHSLAPDRPGAGVRRAEGGGFPACYCFCVGTPGAGVRGCQAPSCWCAARAPVPRAWPWACTTRRSADPAVDAHLPKQLREQRQEPRRAGRSWLRRIQRTLKPGGPPLENGSGGGARSSCRCRTCSTWPRRSGPSSREPVPAVELAGLLHPTPGSGRRALGGGGTADPGARGPRPGLVRGSRWAGPTCPRTASSSWRSCSALLRQNHVAHLYAGKRDRARLGTRRGAGGDRGQAQGAAAAACLKYGICRIDDGGLSRLAWGPWLAPTAPPAWPSRPLHSYPPRRPPIGSSRPGERSPSASPDGTRHRVHRRVLGIR